MRAIFSPVARITFSLLGITLSLVLAAHALRILPDSQAEALAHRKHTVEALTVQLTAGRLLDDLDEAIAVLDAVVERSPEILSAALRDANGDVVLESGSHEEFWRQIPDGRSTPEFVRAPIYSGDVEVGALEVRFEPLPSVWALSFDRGGLTALLLFVTLGGAAGYFFVLRRSLRALDPSAVIPDRVKLAMDTLVEGVIIMDEHEQLLLANRAFGRLLDVPVEQLIGKRASALNWRSADTGGSASELPWVAAMAKRDAVTDCMLELRAANQAIRTFAVNATPVLDPQGRLRGALASFGDVTELRQQNGELQRTLAELEEARQVVEKHNAELRYLAMHDPLTGCLNRRAFFDAFGHAIGAAVAKNKTLCCAMIDVDHFKEVNDRFGHSTGDRVIAFVAETIRLNVSDSDFVCRYGGEEYCVVFVSRGIQEAVAILDRMRAAVSRGASARFGSKLQLTVSAGVTELRAGDANTSALLARADGALYSAKAEGRDRVSRWKPGLDSEALVAQIRAAQIEITGIGKVALDPGQETGLYRALTAASGPLGALEAFRERVTQALGLAARHGWTTALLRVELETAGALGSRAQREILERISALLRRSDILALLLGPRAAEADVGCLPSASPLGPSELGVLLPDVSNVNAIGRAVQRIIKTIGEPLIVDEQETFVSCAIGISVAPIDGQDCDTLMHRADHARRIALVARGGERYAFYQLAMTETLLSAMRVESGLRRALERDEFKIFYQPQIELATGRMRGLEALLRWTDASGNSMKPQDFIPIAESSGLIVSIGDWVMERVCAHAHEWQLASSVLQRVAINVSPVQIMSPGFADRVAAILRSTQVDPRFIDLEITETAFMSDLVAAAATLRQLRRLGLHISLDDFGTGYSSLSYLKQLPIDSLKIDSRFIKDLHERESAALVAGIVGMAHGLGIRVVAEGVETLEALNLLRDLGCDEAQGFLISPPVPAREAFELAATVFTVPAQSAAAGERRPVAAAG